MIANRWWALPFLALGCAAGTPDGGADSVSPRTPEASLVPAGYGSLRQDDVAVRVQLSSVLVRAIPLDESIIRVLSPDSYRALRDIHQAKRAEIEQLATRHRVRVPSLWYISFFGLEPESRFSPMEIVINSSGRDFRPLDVAPLTTGFGGQRIRQREVQSAIYLFDDGININLPLTMTIEGVANSSWGGILRSVERERASIRSRAAQAKQR
ncbi:MAG: hypothetical protein ACREON_19685 [Gemmatimonadaceae bacterium]